MNLLSRISFDRAFTSYSRVQTAYSALVRGRKVQLTWANLRGKDYLNVGCGPFPVEGFINLDYYWGPGMDVCWDIVQGLPFEDASMRGVFTEHCLEHIPFADCKRVLRECRRVIKPGGTLRVVVPDAELYLDLYQRAKSGERVQFPYQSDAESTPMMSVNRIFRNHGHLFAYDEKTLGALLHEAGFLDIRRARFGEGRDARLCIDAKERAVESLYLEASSPV